MTEPANDQASVTPYELAEQVLKTCGRGATKAEWGEELHRLIREDHFEDDGLAEFLHGRIVASLGKYVHEVKAGQEKRRQGARLMALGVSTETGRPISPVISIRRSDGSSQGVLWTEAEPLQFVEAVLREQRVVDGRNDANALRLAIAQLIQSREDLAGLPTLAAVCKAVNVDPDALSLEQLDTAVGGESA